MIMLRSTARDASARVRPLHPVRLAFVLSFGAGALLTQTALAQEPAAPADPPPAADTPADAPPAAAAPAEAPAEAPPAETAPAPQPEAAPDAAAAEPTPKPKPPPYSLPWQLRPVVAGNVVRSDTALAFYKDPKTDKSGSTVASMLLFSYKVAENFAPLVRLGVVSNSPPAGDSGFNFLNPVLGATYALNPVKPLKIGLFLGVTAPVGSGGGNKPNAKNVAANGAGILARSAMDNAMFAVNYFTVFPGVGVAYVDKGLTVQAESTLLQLTRVRGDESADKHDKSKTNLTAGLHVGYFFAPFISAGAELRHQRWLSTPYAIDNDKTNTKRDNTTVAFGPRFHIQLQDKMWLRPGVALALPLDNPMKDSKYKIVQIDVPFVF